MTDVPDFIRRAIEAQGKISSDDVQAKMDDPDLIAELDDTPFVPASPAAPKQETLDTGDATRKREHWWDN